MSIGWQPQPTNVGGDLTGTTDSAVVIGIQTRPVDATAPTPGQIYAWSGTSWVPATLAGGGPEPMGGDVTGITSAATVVAIQTVAVDPSAPLTGDVLAFDGAAWAPLDVGTVAIAGDVTGTLAASSVVAVDGQPVTPATSTIYVDPNGDALSSGRYPTSPTTFAAAVAAAVSGTLIVLAAGAYSPPTISVNGLNIVGLSEQTSAAASAAVRFTTGLTITASNVRFAGIQLDTVTELSSVVGTTVFEQCTIQSTTTITDSAGLTLSLISTTFANILVNGTNTATVVRLRSCPSGGTITNATTGTLTTIAYESVFAAITQTVAGSQLIELNRCYLSGGITRAAGTTLGVLLTGTIINGAIDATGAGPDTVKIRSSAFDRGASTIPALAENTTTNPTRDSALEYVGIAPSTTTTVVAELNWRARNVGAERVIATYADLEYHFPNVGDLHTINAGVQLTATIVMPPPRRVLITNTGYIYGTFGVRHAIVGDYAGPLVSGDPLVMAAVAIVQLNPAGVAIDGTSTTGAPTVLRNVVITSPISPTPVAGVGSIHDLTATGSLVLENNQIDASTSGLTLTGLMAAARITGTTVTNMAPGAIAYTVQAGSIVTVGLELADTIYITNDAAQYVVRLDPAATIPNTPIVIPTSIVGIRIDGNSVTNGIGAVMDPTGITESDIRVLARGSLYGRKSEILGLATFLSTTFITKTYSVPNVPEPIPYSNGITSLTLDAVSQRFTLVTGPGPTDWYMRYDGPLNQVAMPVNGALTIEATSTSSTVIIHIQYRVGALGAWTTVPGGTATTRQTNGNPLHVDANGTITANNDYHFRLAVENSNAAASSRITQINLDATSWP